MLLLYDTLVNCLCAEIRFEGSELQNDTLVQFGPPFLSKIMSILAHCQDTPNPILALF